MFARLSLWRESLASKRQGVIGLIILGAVVLGLLISWITGFLIHYQELTGNMWATFHFGFPISWRFYDQEAGEALVWANFVVNSLFWIIISFGVVIFILKLWTWRLDPRARKMAGRSILGGVVVSLLISWATGFLVYYRVDNALDAWAYCFGYPISWRVINVEVGEVLVWDYFVVNSLFWIIVCFGTGMIAAIVGTILRGCIKK
ncbi:MAG: hypothetical protein ACFFBD_06290 [Candidatus Hodarchaeota archaeon]